MKLRPKKNGDDSLYQYVSRRYNISQLARDTDLTRPTIIAILNGDTKKPGHEKLEMLTKLLNMEWEYDEYGLYFLSTDVNGEQFKVAENPNPYGLNKEQMELLEMIEAADDKTQDMIWKVIDTILATRKQK